MSTEPAGQDPRNLLPEWTVVGFSGHRKLPDSPVAAAAIAVALDRLGPGDFLATVSSIASGADTLFVAEASRRRLPYLLILPFAPERFQKDFAPAEWQQALPLIEQASHVEEVSGEESDEAAYLEAGVRTADLADVMVVVWNGLPAAGPGGTGDIVAYTRQLGKPLILIDPATGKITTERLEPLVAERLKMLALHRASAGSAEAPRDLVENYYTELDREAELHAPESRNLLSRIVVLQLAAASIGLTAFTLERFIRHDLLNSGSTLLELLCLGAAWWAAFRHRKQTDQWMENRIQAEICRSFLAMWHLRRKVNHSPRISLHGFDRLCRDLRLIRLLDRAPSPGLAAARDQYLENRVEDQRKFFSRKGEKARVACRRFKLYSAVSTSAATVCSLLACTLYLLELFQLVNLAEWATILPKYVSLLLPLVSTACFLLIVTQDHSRRAVRYDELATQLEAVRIQLGEVRTWSALTRIATETEEKLLQEVVEWHSFRRFAGEPT